jgi:hypothetical protein
MSGPEAIAGLVLAVPGLIDLAIKYGQFLQGKVKLFMGAESDSRLQGFIVELTAGQINDILLFFKDIVKKLPLDFLNQLSHATKILQITLQTAIEAFPEDSYAEKKGVASKAKYAMYDAKKIKEAVKDLEEWKRRFTERAMVFKNFIYDHDRESEASKDSAKQAPVEMIELHGDGAQKVKERLSEILRNQHPKSGPLILPPVKINDYTVLADASLWYSEDNRRLVEFHNYAGKSREDVETMREAVRHIANCLRAVDSSTMKILECEGFSDNIAQEMFALHFFMPANQNYPRSLRSLLAGEENKKGKKHSLTDRVRLAQSIASAVLYVHSSGFVHKNIRPENIVVFESIEKGSTRFPYSIGHPYLVGYDGVRQEKDASIYADVTGWQRRIYVPKERLDPVPARAKFSWKHDIYSLGVILLEIAIWDNFANPDGRVGKTLKAAPDMFVPLMEELKNVPRLLGDKYRDATMSCLKMLEGETGEAVRDEDGVLLGTNYICQVLDKLEAIVL